jgi:hypothetical protein
MSVNCNAGPAGTDSFTVTVCKNATTYPPLASQRTSVVVSITGTNTANTYYNTSVDFAIGDKISVFIERSASTSAQDVSIQLDLF